MNDITPEAIFLEDRAILRVEGEDARSFLQGLITNDMDGVDDAHAIYSALQTPQGKFLFDFFVVEADGAFLIDCEKARLADLQKRLTLYKLRAAVTLSVVSNYGVAAIYGPAAASSLGFAAEEAGAARDILGGHGFIDPRNAAMGVRVIGELGSLAEELMALGLEEGTLENYHASRIARCVPNHSLDITPEQVFILDFGFDRLNGVSFSKGCYIGQEIVSRMRNRGTSRKMLARVRVDGALPAPGTEIKDGERSIGVLLSGQDSNALALMRTDRWDKGATLSTADGMDINVFEADDLSK